ncbi:transmembrane protein 250 isoform X2 [Pteropus medius]|uniref:Transmembrane protein 250 isoform X2 n=1 Tax=Pteropus vampyrus TaxID=132908 RepID=A0A6P3QQK1_PTEVA|nr:transmembrane protein 250 isoform X2 [Pteropus vampyrus]XP_016008521.2 transmembrane protein 250 [Rousettus aegyptiacus]XP_016008522.2 transmembrane protein 250 [Rousettus aegyptiacus]XP_016008523.2 transmembrane protein 250 [Rousettus aegyptiacus]XP_036095224.1 transmembrane protein 250 [Rousettus aegyptiacus]XP_036095225.1 transmembrane protein 250 [Rousettus aegyptiacus]XP_039714747.1 transmembrane protein 250 isoform X2 [Pteropus giganteus]
MTPMLTAAWTPPPPRASAAAQAPMPVMPIPRRVRSFHGPHTTCLHAACGPARASRLARTKYNNFDVYVRARWLYGFIRFLLYFSCSLFTAALWGALAALFCLQYLGVRVLLRFQRKLSVLLLLLGRRRVDFRLLNELLVYGIHVTMLLVGGLGWCFMVFVDM